MSDDTPAGSDRWETNRVRLKEGQQLFEFRSGLLAAIWWNWLSLFRTSVHFPSEPRGNVHGLWLHYSAPLALQKTGAQLCKRFVSVFIFKMTQFGAFPCKCRHLPFRRYIHLTYFGYAIYTIAPGWDRTSDHRFRRPVLYPLSYGCPTSVHTAGGSPLQGGLSDRLSQPGRLH
jgi:hypothetical protein